MEVLLVHVRGPRGGPVHGSHHERLVLLVRNGPAEVGVACAGGAGGRALRVGHAEQRRLSMACKRREGRGQVVVAAAVALKRSSLCGCCLIYFGLWGIFLWEIEDGVKYLCDKKKTGLHCQTKTINGMAAEKYGICYMLIRK